MKKILCILVGVIMIILLVGCNEKLNTGGPISTSQSSTKQGTTFSQNSTRKSVSEVNSVSKSPSISASNTATASSSNSNEPSILPEKEKTLAKTVAHGIKTIFSSSEFLNTNATSLDFNCFKFNYSTTNALKCTLYYKVSTAILSDEVYLEKGNNCSFRSLISGYLSGNSGIEIQKLEVVSLVEGNTQFSITNFETEKIAVIASDIYYLENNRYKIGVKLSWGGGISYLCDKQDGDNSIDNLINNADTGRLVQQSYYGISELPYVCGTYNDKSWRYNPVQGGNLVGEASRLIDFSIDTEAKTIYVKCQPRDWAKSGIYALAYMENTYVLKSNYIEVDNRFIDFSGYNHDSASQELPAFYTLSYFKNFNYYSGNSAWTDGTITTKTDLPFWGDTATHDSCMLSLASKETWCAWTSDGGYGIGLYVPNVTSMLAGRHAFNGSKNSADGATNYVAPLRTITLKTYKPIEYSYIISTGSLSTIRNTFKSLKDFASNESLGINYSELDYSFLNLNSENAKELIENLNDCTLEFDKNEGALRFNHSGADSYFGIRYSNASTKINATQKKTLKITYKCAGDLAGEVFYCTGEVLNPKAQMSKSFTYTRSTTYNTITLDMSKATNWSGNINYLRFDFNINQSTPMYIKSIEIC